MASKTSEKFPVNRGTAGGISYYVTDVTTLADGSVKRETYRSDNKGNNKVLVQTVQVDKDGKLTKDEILSSEIQELIPQMWDVMKKAGGIGLAAPQIGISIQLAVIKLESESERYDNLENSEEFVIFNPKLEVIDEQKQGFWEGCLSVPGLRGYVERPRKLKINYFNENAVEKEVIVEDFLATVFQHELDHLFGFLYVDRLNSTKDLVFEEELTNIASEKLLD